MLAGNIRYKAELYKNLGEANNPELVFYKPINIQIQKRSGNQTLQAFQVWQTKTLLLRIRKRDDINDMMFVKLNDEFYFISNIVPVDGFSGDLLIDLVLSSYGSS